MPRLIVMRGVHHDHHDLVGSRTTLGAHPENDVVIEGDGGVSRRHCTITERNGVFMLRDRGSRSGTFLNGRRVEEAELSYGDRLRLGQTVVLFVSTGRKQKDERTARRLGNLLILQEINKELNTETDSRQLLELIMDTAIRLIGAERGFLILVKGKQLEFRVARNVDHEIMAMPMGYDTLLAAGGGSISGGQRQRIALARALMNDPVVLVLDEATSNLDAISEKEVQRSLDQLDCTRIVIAHRLSTIMGADKICYLEDGVIAEQGTFDELMAEDGLFAELARRQLA